MPWSELDAEEVQRHLRGQVDLSTRLTSFPKSVVGLDVSYEKATNRVCAAAVAIELESLAVTDVATVVGEATFPYVPGLLAFREAPILLEALQGLANEPEVLVCDGYGIAHPRRFGLACHVGVLTGLPSFGVAKTSFIADFANPDLRRGAGSPLKEGGETLGRAVRTQDGVRPVFVSVGHRIGLDQACDLTLRLCPRYRIPEATRQADIASRRVLRTASRAGG
ncbi:endonuclease V [Salinispora cortesiana]|uniref:endonuclease V n=1 Tax=Salinispora cortesiana TaxID=1305843 RepID=UPI00040CE70F|nr:endonuclease V [Salinispora cortesiana]